MSAVTSDWKAEARDLRAQGLSERAIADAVGKAASTVHDALKDMPVAGEVDASEAARYAAAADAGEVQGGPIPGQQDLNGGEVPADGLAGFKAEAGEAVGDMPPRPPVTESVYVEQIRIDGTTQLALKVGGKTPQSCEVTFTGKAVVNGFLRKGDVLRGTCELRVLTEGAKDKLDKQTGIVTESVQLHKAVVTDLELS